MFYQITKETTIGSVHNEASDIPGKKYELHALKKCEQCRLYSKSYFVLRTHIKNKHSMISQLNVF